MHFNFQIQLRRERTEERRKMFQLADTKRRTGLSSIDNTPFARWKKALPSFPMSKSIDSDDHKTVGSDEIKEYTKSKKKKGNYIFKLCVKHLILVASIFFVYMKCFCRNIR